MSISEEPSPSRSVARDFADLGFGLMDASAIFWKPVFNGSGRWFLELAALNAKNLRAGIDWTQQIAAQPTKAIDANLQLYGQLAKNFQDSVPRISGAMTRAAEPVAPIKVIRFPDDSQTSAENSTSVASSADSRTTSPQPTSTRQVA